MPDSSRLPTVAPATMDHSPRRSRPSRKSEGRTPKEIRNPKSEIQILPQRRRTVSLSAKSAAKVCTLRKFLTF
jgi:hypothetical protein